MQRMTYRLYNRDGSGGFVVEAALTLLEADFELVTLDSRPGTPCPRIFARQTPGGRFQPSFFQTERP
jgi:hypothetical protein